MTREIIKEINCISKYMTELSLDRNQEGLWKELSHHPMSLVKTLQEELVITEPCGCHSSFP